MRIVVNDIAASYGGALTVLKSFYSFVKENDSENEFVFLLSGRYIEETERIKVITIPNVKKSSFHKLWFDFIIGKRLLKKLNPDRVISLQNIITFGYKGEQSVYVHQAIPFQTEKKFSFFRKNESSLAVYQYIIGAIIKKSIKKANHVYVQTAWMKKNIISQCCVSNDKVEVVPFSVKSAGNNMLYKGNGRSFFYPATSELAYKNHSIIYEADRLLQIDKIKDYSIVLTLVRNNASESSIKYTGLLNRDQLYREYSESVLLFPSYIETVGLPLIEAMEIGAVIIAADCEYSREILEGYSNAFLFNPFSPRELASLMKKSIAGELVTNESKRVVENRDDYWRILLNSLL